MVMDMIFHHKCSVKSVQANSNSSAFVSEYVVALNCGHIAVSQEDSPASVGENQISSNIYTSGMGKAYPYLVVVNVVLLKHHSHVVVVVFTGINYKHSLSCAVVYAASFYCDIICTPPNQDTLITVGYCAIIQDKVSFKVRG